MVLFRRATLTMAMGVWLERAKVRGFSPKTIKNTETSFKMLAQFIPETTRIERLSVSQYEQMVLKMRESGYAPETIYGLNTTLRKLLNLAYRRGLVRYSLAARLEGPKFSLGAGARVVKHEDFLRIMRWFEKHEYWRGGVELYRKYRFLFILLYNTGVRIGEALALGLENFKKVNEDIWRVRVDKSYLSDFGVIKETKNGKIREIPILTADFREFLDEIHAIRAREQSAQMDRGDTPVRIFDVSPQAVRQVFGRVCDELGLPRYRLHEFRHTYISRLIAGGVPLPVVAEVSGDTQATVLKRYSHVLDHNDALILAACASDHAAQPERYPAQERLRRLRSEHHELSNK